MSELYFIVGAFATYRIAHMLVKEDGPFGVFLDLRASRFHFIQELFGCMFCMSVWVAAVIAALLLGVNLRVETWFVTTFGLSGASILIYLITKRLL
jgi:hypothetical protein